MPAVWCKGPASPTGPAPAAPACYQVPQPRGAAGRQRWCRGRQARPDPICLAPQHGARPYAFRRAARAMRSCKRAGGGRAPALGAPVGLPEHGLRRWPPPPLSLLQEPSHCSVEERHARGDTHATPPSQSVSIPVRLCTFGHRSHCKAPGEAKQQSTAPGGGPSNSGGAAPSAPQAQHLAAAPWLPWGPVCRSHMNALIAQGGRPRPRTHSAVNLTGRQAVPPPCRRRRRPAPCQAMCRACSCTCFLQACRRCYA